MDKKALLRPRLDEREVDIPGVGTVRVRGLSRGEVVAMRKATDSENLDGPRMLVIERKMIAAGMVDPVLTEGEVKRWQASAPFGELTAVTDAISELSGLTEGASKSGVPATGDGPGSGVRDVPGDPAGDDGGSAASGDEL